MKSELPKGDVWMGWCMPWTVRGRDRHLVVGNAGYSGLSSSFQAKARSSAKVNVHSLIRILIYSPVTRQQHTPHPLPPSCRAFLQEGGQRLIPSKLRKWQGNIPI